MGKFSGDIGGSHTGTLIMETQLTKTQHGGEKKSQNVPKGFDNQFLIQLNSAYLSEPQQKLYVCCTSYTIKPYMCFYFTWLNSTSLPTGKVNNKHKMIK